MYSNGNNISSRLEDVRNDKPDIAMGNDQPCSSIQINAKWTQLEVAKPTVISRKFKTKPRKMDSTFSYQVRHPMVLEKSHPQRISATKLQLHSTLVALPSVSVLMRVPNMMLDNF